MAEIHVRLEIEAGTFETTFQVPDSMGNLRRVAVRASELTCDLATDYVREVTGETETP